MRFELTLRGKDAVTYGATHVLDFDALDEDTDCETLIAWEEEADYSLHLLKLQSDTQPARWKRALVWFALKQSGSDVSFEEFKPRGLGGLGIGRIRNADEGDADPPASSEAESEPAS